MIWFDTVNADAVSKIASNYRKQADIFSQFVKNWAKGNVTHYAESLKKMYNLWQDSLNEFGKAIKGVGCECNPCECDPCECGEKSKMKKIKVKRVGVTHKLRGPRAPHVIGRGKNPTVNSGKVRAFRTLESDGKTRWRIGWGIYNWTADHARGHIPAHQYADYRKKIKQIRDLGKDEASLIRHAQAPSVLGLPESVEIV